MKSTCLKKYFNRLKDKQLEGSKMEKFQEDKRNSKIFVAIGIVMILVGIILGLVSTEPGNTFIYVDNGHGGTIPVMVSTYPNHDLGYFTFILVPLGIIFLIGGAVIWTRAKRSKP
jgi:hypothetical protein